MADRLTPPAELVVNSCILQPMRRVSVARSEARFVDSQVEPFHHWEASIQTQNLKREKFGAVMVWLSRIKAGGDYGLIYDFGRPRPIAHDDGSAINLPRPGGGVFAGEGTITAISSSRVLALAGLSDGFQFTAGDYIEIRQTDNRRSLHYVSADTVSDASGNATVNIEPPLDTQNFTTSAVFNVEKPSILMQLFDEPSPNGGQVFHTIGFVLQEVTL